MSDYQSEKKERYTMVRFQIKRAAEQDPGVFDNGRIKERKPVNFPGVGTQQARYGPLLYWSWAWSENGGLIAEHPHQGFEIMSYVLRGTMEHRDSLGTWKSLKPDDLQVMQTNWGVTHSERFAEGEHTEMFQIWFEPNLRESIQQQPRYSDYRSETFPWKSESGYRIKHIVGKEAPVQLVSDARFDEVVVTREYSHERDQAYAVLVAIEGTGEVKVGDESERLERGDATYLKLDDAASYRVTALSGEFRFAQIIVPQKVSYPLYPDF